MAINDQDIENLDELQALLESPAAPVDRSMMPRRPAAAPAIAAPMMQSAPPMEPAIPDAPAGPMSDNDRLHQAQQQDNKQQFYANLLRSFQGAIQGAAPGTGFKADMGVADAIAQGANAEKNLKSQMALAAEQKKAAREEEKFAMEKEDFQMKLAKSKLDFQDMQANNDPSSPQSKIAQDRVMEVQAKMGQPVNEAQIRSQSGANLFKYFPFLQQDLTTFYQNQQRDEDQKRLEGRDKATDSKDAKQLKFQYDQMQQQKDMAEMKDKTANAKIESDEIKADKKEKSKENQAIHKENRKLRTELDKAESSVDAQLKMMQDTKKKFEAYSKKSVGGTGPLATLGGATTLVSQPTEAMNSAFKNVSFDTLIKSFQGMSKAVDSDAERRAFESTQPSITQDDKTNMMLLDQRINALKSLKAKTAAAKAKFDREGRFTEDDPTPEKEMSDNDKQALAWANANPTDPRAVEIKKRLGQ